MDKRCPYCGGLIADSKCTHCGAVVPPEMQVDPEQAPEFKPFSPEDVVSSVESIPWERQTELGWWNALIETIKEIVSSPTDFFRRMSHKGGYGGPFIYGLVLGTAGAILGQVWGLVGNAAGLAIPSLLGMSQNAGQMAGSAASGFLSFILGIIMAPFGVAMGMFAGAGILHLMLMILGGANEEFETTFKCVAFSQTAQLAQVVPLLGVVAAPVWAIVLQVIALRESHDISTGKAVLAILLPTLVCCCVVVVVALIVLGGIAGIAGMAGGGMQ